MQKNELSNEPAGEGGIDVRRAESVTCGLRIKRLVIKMMAAAFAWFMFIPENWEILFGPFGFPLAWVADAVPSINKMAEVSPMPGTVRGVIASSVILAPIAGLVVLFKDCIAIRVREFEEQRGIRGIIIAPFAGTLFLVVLGGYMFWLPTEVTLNVTPTKGHLMMSAMLTNRLFLAGGALSAGFLWAGWTHIMFLRAFNIFSLIFKPNRK